MKRKLVFFFASLLIVLGGTYLYQIPYKKYKAGQKLYVLLREEKIAKDEIHIDAIIKDIKSARGGYGIYFNVDGSSLNYNYDYSFKHDDWIKVYIGKNNGISIPTERIIFDE